MWLLDFMTNMKTTLSQNRVNGDVSSASTSHKLKDRHIRMIALGGVIGAGLFVGSSAAIKQAGPCVLISYLTTGLLIILIMRMLGEMLISRESVGSFVDCIRVALGNGSGFVAGWLYWSFWVVTIGAEAIGGAIALQDWVNIPVWVLAPTLILAVNLVNLISVHVFGECEFWLSSIKVFSLIIFSAIGLVSLAGFIGPQPVTPVANLMATHTLAPYGWGAIFAAIPTVIFSMMGSESATVAAAESKNAGENLAKVTRSIGIRITVFFLLSIALILLLYPWSALQAGYSPFVTVLRHLGIPGAAEIMQVVTLSAILSCLNSSIYISSRTLRGLADKGQAPEPFSLLSVRLIPKHSVFASSVIGLAAAFSSIFSPDLVFAFLLSATGAVILIIYGMLIISHAVFVRQDPHNKAFILPMTGVLHVIMIGAIIAVFAAMLIQPGNRGTAFSSLGSVVFYAIIYWCTRHRHREVEG